MVEREQIKLILTRIPGIENSRYALLAGQIRGQMSVCRAWNALPNNVEHKVEAIMEPFRTPA